MYGDLVSVIMPAYNCADFIGESIESVLKQTYSNLELLIVDDSSTDNTLSIIKKYAKQDKRLRYIHLKKNCGGAVARNTAVDQAVGIYLAFNDSDDLWKPDKLEKQIRFMSDNNYDFTCTDYGKIDEKSNVLTTVIHSEKVYDYDLILKKCPGNSTVIYNCKNLGKVYALDIRRRNDFVMWLALIKKSQKAYGLQEILGYHRVHLGSISYNKSMLLKYQWKVYRDFEKLNLLKCCWLMIYKIVSSLNKDN